MAKLLLRHVYKIYPGAGKPQKAGSDSKKRSGDFVAVKDFNMEINDGEFIVFVGPSGCGKSTTLRMIAGLEEISGGEIYIDDQLVNDVDAKDRDIAMVFQSYALYPHLSAYDNIAFGLRMRKIPVPKLARDGKPVIAIDSKKVGEITGKIRTLKKQLEDALKELKKLESATETDQTDLDYYTEKKALFEKRISDAESELEYYKTTPVQIYNYVHMTKEEIDEKVQWAAKILGIEDLLDSKPAEMSGGQRQRIALGRAMVRGPKVFLLDEPLSNLDAKLRTAMRAEIVKLHNQLKTTFIYVTHDQIEAMTMGTRIVVMKLGVVQQIDTPTNLFDFPENKFVAGFIGTPQMNFFEVEIQRDGEWLGVSFADGQKARFSLSKMRNIEKSYLDGEPHTVYLGARGESIKLSEDGIKASLTIKEVLGNTTQLFLRFGENDEDFIVSVQERNSLVPGDKVGISFIESAVHLFDKETELSIMSREYGNN